jgi:AcrR family transcriptional regulator
VSTSPVLDRSKRVELAKAARSEEILAAARRVFASRGFRGTTIADIADEAGIALGTIYLYFASKEAVFAALHQQLNGLIGAALTAVVDAATLEETVRLRIAQVFDVCARNHDLLRLVVLNTDPESEVTKRLRSEAAVRERPLTGLFEQAMAQGLIRDGDACIMTRLITGLVTIAVYQAFVIADGKDAAKYEDACVEMIVAYLRPLEAAP